MLLSVVTAGREREPRARVLAPCQLKNGGTWAEACIHNVSARGLLAASDRPPEPGAYVEMRRALLVIIGRVMWREGRFFGVRTQDRIDARALMGSGRPDRAAAPDRVRSLDGLAAEGRAARRVERNRLISRLLQFGLLAGATAAAAALVATEAHQALARPLASIGEALSGSLKR